MDLTPGTCLTQSWCCPVEQDNSIWGGCRKVWEETKRVCSRRKTKSQKGKNGGEVRGKKNISPHLPGAVPADSQTLTGAVPNPEDIGTSKASRFELGSRCPSQLEKPRSSFRGQAGSMKNQQQRPKDMFRSTGHLGAWKVLNLKVRGRTS